MDSQQLIEALSQSEITDINTKVLLHILKSQMVLSAQLDKVKDSNELLLSKIASLDARLTKCEERIPHTSQTDTSGTISNGESQSLSETVETLSHDNNFLQQWRIDNDIFLSGFSSKPDITELSDKLSQKYQFQINEITYKYSFSIKNPRTRISHHFAVIGLSKRAIKQQIFTEKSTKGPLFQSDLSNQSSGNNDPEVFLSNRLTVHNLRLQRQLSNMKSNGSIYRIIYKNCSLYALCSPTENPVPIKSFDDIQKLTTSLQIRAQDNPFLQPTQILHQSQITSYFHRH